MTETNYIDVEEHKGEIFSWVRNMDGELSLVTQPANDFYYCFIPSNDPNLTSKFQSIYQQPMKQIFFDSRWDLREYAKTRSNVCESDIQPVYRAMGVLFADAPADAPVNIGFYDIEVDFDLKDGKGYPKPDNPHGEINSISLFDVTKQQYVMFMFESNRSNVKLIDSENYPVVHIWCGGEYELLKAFAEYIDHIDVLGGWYTDFFDLPYIMERSILLFGKEKATTMYCRDGFHAKREEFVDENANEQVRWSLIGRQHVDMLDLYKKFVPGQKESFSLDAICELELQMNKIQYEDDGDLGSLYRHNPQKFFDYSLHDSRLLKKLNDKLSLMELGISLARSAGVKIGDVTGSVKPIEQKFIKFCRAKGNIVLPDKVQHEKQKFPGAIVYDTISGVNKWTFSIDLTALYPSVMIMLGLSTETMLFQCLGEYTDYLKVMTKSNERIRVQDVKSNELFEVSASEMEEMIRDNCLVISANGTIFNGELGLLAEFVKSIFDERQTEKKAAAAAFKANDPETGNRHDLAQKVYKIFANSLYGCISNNYFRLFDLRMARSITLTGQMISKFQAHAANGVIEEALEGVAS